MLQKNKNTYEQIILTLCQKYKRAKEIQNLNSKKACLKSDIPVKLIKIFRCYISFREGFSTRHCLLAMTEKWRKYLDKDGVSGVACGLCFRL